MRAAIYARVSSAQQRDANTISAQLAALPEYAARQGWQVVARYVDDGESAKAGSLARRRGLKSLLADATQQPRPWDVVLVWDLDRLSRSEDQGERGHILGVLRVAGVKVASLTGGVLDLSSSEGDLLSGVQAWAAADWLRKHRERVKAGKVRAVARGAKPAGPTPYGYRYDRTTGWSICEDEARVLRLICQRVAEGHSLSAIADEIAASGAPRGRGGDWTPEWVWQLIRRRDYYATGQWVADKRRGSVVAIPVIHDPVTWAAAQRALDAHSRRGLRQTRHEYLLQGLAECECGAKIHIHSAGSYRVGGELRKVGARYACQRQLRPRRDEERCDAIGYRYRIDEVDADIWQALGDWLQSPRLVRAIAAARRAAHDGDASLWRADLEAAEAALARLERAETATLSRARRGLLSDGAADRELATIARERAAHKRQADGARRALAGGADARSAADALEEAASALRAALPVATPAQRRGLARRILEGPARLTRDGIDLPISLSPVSAAGSVMITSTTLRDRLRIAAR